MNDEDTTIKRPHDLFPRDETTDPPPPPIDFIYIERITSTGTLSASRPLKPHELQNAGDIAARFGRGTYNVIARTERGKLAGKNMSLKIDFGGEPRSMVVDADDEPPPPPRAATQAPMMGGDPMTMMMGFFQMMREDARANAERDERARQAQAERDQRAHEINMAAQRENTAMLVAALQRPPPPADTSAAQVLGQVLAQVIPTTASRGPSPGVKDLKEMMELVRVASPESKKDDDGFQSMIAAAVGSYLATKEAAMQQQPPPGAAPQLHGAQPSHPNNVAPAEPPREPPLTNPNNN